jgi:hypothetical protein
MATQDPPLSSARQWVVTGVSLAAGGPPPNQVVAEMLHLLENYLPPPTPQLPDRSVWVASVSERSLGLGNYRGAETRDTFAPVELKGTRLDALVRFVLWAKDPSQAEAAAVELDGRLLGDHRALWAAGFLRLGVEASLPAEHVPAARAWRKQVDYRVLYEYRYEDLEAATGLIVRIPIDSVLERRDSPDREMNTISDEIVRWGYEAVAEPLVVHGRLAVVALTAMDFVPGQAPSGEVVLTRTFDDAVGPPTEYHSLRPFLAAITHPDTPDRHAQLTFGLLPAFLNAIQQETPGHRLPRVPLGDQGADGLPDLFISRIREIDPPIVLQSPADRLEIAYRDPATQQAVPFDDLAVVYLRVRRG